MNSLIPLGQPLVTLLIQKMVETGRVGGSYLFTGPRGVGKKTAARFLAMALNCHEESFPPCGHCPACSKILSQDHPDFLTVSPEAEKQTISIEQVRELQKALAFGPYEGKRRVVIIDPAERLGLEAANALLLTLEDPPSHTLIILITSAMYTLLETIRSRCQVIRFSPLSKRFLIEIVRRFSISVEPDDPMLEFCQGSASRLLAFLKPEFKGKYEEMDAFIASVLTGSLTSDLIETPKWAKQRADMEIFLERALWITRDLLATLEDQTGKGIINVEAVKGIRSKIPRISSDRLLNLIDTVLKSMEDLKHNAAPELIFDINRFEMEEVGG